MILVPERSLNMKFVNTGKRVSTLEWKHTESIVEYAVCPWCRNSFRNALDDTSVCNECGTIFDSIATYSIVPKESIELKDKNMDKHIG